MALSIPKEIGTLGDDEIMEVIAHLNESNSLRYPIGQDIPLNRYIYGKRLIWNSIKFVRDFHAAVDDNNYRLIFEILSGIM